MSERARLISAILWRAALVTLVSAPAAAAQTVAEYTHRVDSLAPLWRTALATKATLDSSRANQLPSDTVREGNFLILTESGYVALARRAAALASPRLDRTFGASAAGFRLHPIVLRRRREGNARDDSTQIESAVVTPRGELYMRSSDLLDANTLATTWQRKAEEFITQDLGPGVRNWLGATILSDPPGERVIAAGRVDLVLSLSKVSDDCVAGDFARCTQALGLVTVDDPAFVLYDEEERRELLEHNAFALQRVDEAKYARCAQRKLQATCDSLVHSIPVDAVPTPVPPNVRQNFIRYALMVGGDGAFDRLAGATGTVSDRIAAAARMPTDSLVRRWHATLMSSRSSSTAIDLTTAISSIFWAAACGALALRSSRWR